MGKREMRMNRLIDAINSRGYLSIKESSQLLQVSEMTIRRDLEAIAGSHLVNNVNGVLMSSTGSAIRQIDKKYDLLDETAVHNEVKSLIGCLAASLISADDFVIFDTGTTTEQIIPHINPNIELGALCFNRNTLELLCRNPRINLAMAGGYYHPHTQMFASEEGVAFIQSIRANKVFVSAAGVHENLGISCANSYEVPVKRAILQSARQHILVVDSNKFDVVRSAYFCDLSDIDIVVTDKGLPEEWGRILQEQGIVVHRA